MPWRASWKATASVKALGKGFHLMSRAVSHTSGVACGARGSLFERSVIGYTRRLVDNLASNRRAC